MPRRTNTSPPIRRATLDDHRAIRRLLVDNRFDAHNIWKDEIKPGLDGTTDDYCCAVYERSDTIIGVIVWDETNHPTNEIRWVAVHKNYQSRGHGTGSGIGKALVEYVKKRAPMTRVEKRPEVTSWYRRQSFNTDSSDPQTALKYKRDD